MSNTTKTQAVEFNLDRIYSLAEAKDMLKKNKGPIPGLKFYAENSRGEKTLGVVLPDLSNRGKIQATLKCLDGGPDHVREISDWHQSLRSPKSKKSVKAQDNTLVPA
jgi:hypothetical protein